MCLNTINLPLSVPTVRNWIPSILSLFPVQKWRPWQKCRDSASPHSLPPESLSLRAPPLHTAGFPSAEPQGHGHEREFIHGKRERAFLSSYSPNIGVCVPLWRSQLQGLAQCNEYLKRESSNGQINSLGIKITERYDLRNILMFTFLYFVNAKLSAKIFLQLLGWVSGC